MSETSGSAAACDEDGDGHPEDEREPIACAPSRRAVSASPAPAARATCAVVAYWRKLNIANQPPSTTAAMPSGRELGAAQVTDDRGVDEEIQRLCGERAQRRHREPDDLAVVLRPEPHPLASIVAS
jgi:hypothetical protein